MAPPGRHLGHAGVLLLVLCVGVVVLHGLRRILHGLLPVLLRRRVAVLLLLLLLLRLARGARVGLRHDAIDHREHLLHLLVSRGWGGGQGLGSRLGWGQGLG